MKQIFLLLLFGPAVILEGSLTTIPFVLSILTVLFIKRTNTWIIYALAFFAGLYLDVVHVRNLGMTSLFYAVFLLTISLYERKFETNTFQFAALASGVGALLFLTMFPQAFIVMHVIFATVTCLILFVILRTNINPKNRYGENSQ